MKLEQITTKQDRLLQDESGLRGTACGLLIPESAEEVAEGFRRALAEEKRLTLRGGGTGLTGGAVPQGGQLMDLSHMTRMGEIRRDPVTGEATLFAECGVTLENIQKAAGAAGLFFPPSPTEETATVGGFFAMNGAGPNGLGYGPGSRYVKALDWVTPAGRLWHLERGEAVCREGRIRLPDGRTLDFNGIRNLPLSLWEEGMDLIDFLAGSEGCFGAAVSLELLLLPEPAELWGVLFFFGTQDGAVEFGRSLQSAPSREGAKVTAAEFYDRGALELLAAHRENPLLNRLPEFPAGAAAALYVELEGENTGASMDALMELTDLFDRCGGREEDTWAENGRAAVQKFRDMRHAVPSLLNELGEEYRDGRNVRWETDFAGKPEEFSTYLALYVEKLEQYGIPAVIYGHLLENQLRVALLPENGEQRGSCDRLVLELAEKVYDLGGNLVGEYGVGQIKRGLVALFTMSDMKRKVEGLVSLLDPERLLNP